MAVGAHSLKAARRPATPESFSRPTACVAPPPCLACSKMDAASRKFAELEKREERLGEREAAAEQAEAAAAQRGGEVEEREAAAGVREASVAGALVLFMGAHGLADQGRWQQPQAGLTRRHAAVPGKACFLLTAALVVPGMHAFQRQVFQPKPPHPCVHGHPEQVPRVHPLRSSGALVAAHSATAQADARGELSEPTLLCQAGLIHTPTCAPSAAPERELELQRLQRELGARQEAMDAAEARLAVQRQELAAQQADLAEQRQELEALQLQLQRREEVRLGPWGYPVDGLLAQAGRLGRPWARVCGSRAGWAGGQADHLPPVQVGCPVRFQPHRRSANRPSFQS